MDKRLAAIYVRTNLDCRSVGEYRRIDGQIKECLWLAVNKGYSESQIHIYKDEGVSGLAHKAPGREWLICELNNYDCLVVPRLNRLSRSMAQLTVLCKAIRKAGVRLYVCDGQLDNERSKKSTRKLMKRVKTAWKDLAKEASGRHVQSLTNETQ